MRRQDNDPAVTAAVLATCVFTVAAAVNVQVPLYTTYASARGMGNGALSLTFATYAATLIPMLLLFGGISDVSGRRIVLVAAMISSLTATSAMLFVPSAAMLFAARALQGISVALSMSTATAWLVDLGLGQRASAIVASTSALGFGAGALATSLFLMHRFTLRPPSFAILLILTIISIALLFRMHDVRKGGLLAPVLPRYPAGTVVPALAIMLAWAASSLVISLVPSQLRALGLALWSGPALFVVNATGAVAQIAARAMSDRATFVAGCAIAPTGFAVLVIGALNGRLPLILLGAAIVGTTAYGLVYVGGLRAVIAAAGEQKARCVAGYFLAAYVGFSLPAVGVGFLADRLGLARSLYIFAGLLTAAEGLVIVLILRGRASSSSDCVRTATSRAQPHENVTPAPP